MDFDKEIIEEMCSKIDLLEYASQFYDFKKDGNDYVTSCPNHSDSTPSLKITPSKNLFHCFGCGAAGTILQWKQAYENESFKEALHDICLLTGNDIEDVTLKKVPESIKIYKKFKNNQVRNKEPIKRTILSDLYFDKFENEYPEEWVNEGISEESLDKYKIRIDVKTNRIVYPIYDDNDNLIGFKGRTRFARFKEMGINKYQNYQKIGTTNFFVGMKENRNSILKHRTAIVFEGIKSVMKSDDYGYDYALAAETSSLNDEQIKILIKMGIKNVIIAFDKGITLTKIIKNTKTLSLFCNVFVVIDKNNLLEDKMSPVDKGKEVYESLLRSVVKI